MTSWAAWALGSGTALVSQSWLPCRGGLGAYLGCPAASNAMAESPTYQPGPGASTELPGLSWLRDNLLAERCRMQTHKRCNWMHCCVSNQSGLNAFEQRRDLGVGTGDGGVKLNTTGGPAGHLKQPHGGWRVNLKNSHVTTSQERTIRT